MPPRRSYMLQSCPSHSFKTSLLSLWSSSSPPHSYQFGFLESSDSPTCHAALSGSEVVDEQRASSLTDYETPTISCLEKKATTKSPSTMPSGVHMAAVSLI